MMEACVSVVLLNDSFVALRNCYCASQKNGELQTL